MRYYSGQQITSIALVIEPGKQNRALFFYSNKHFFYGAYIENILKYGHVFVRELEYFFTVTE